MNHANMFQSFWEHAGTGSTDGDSRRNVRSREGIVFGDNFTQILLAATAEHLPDRQTPAAPLFRFHSDPILSFNVFPARAATCVPSKSLLHDGLSTMYAPLMNVHISQTHSCFYHFLFCCFAVILSLSFLFEISTIVIACR